MFLNSRAKSLLILLPCVLAFSGCGHSEAEAIQQKPPKVTIGHPVLRTLTDEDDFNGWLQPSETVEVRARVRGHIRKVEFKDGDLVKRDQPLFELDPRPFQVQIDQAIAHSKALESQKNAAEKDVARYRVLLKSGGASQQQLDKSVADAAAYDAQIDAMKEEVKQHQLNLEFSRVTAPIAGRISRAMLTQGNLVNAGGSDPLLTTIVAIDPLYAYFSMSERALQQYLVRHPKESAADAKPLRSRKIPFRFGLDSETGYPHSGNIDFADNRIDPNTGTIQVRGVVDNKQSLFVPGSRIRVRVPVSDPYSATLVPEAAILSDQDKRYLLVLDDKNVVARRDVKLGKLLDDGMRVVLPDSPEAPNMTAADRIVVLGLQRARINYPVDPVEGAEAGKAS